MSNSDRSRSPASQRSGATSSHQALPGFPRWCGPMGSAVRTLPPAPRTQIIPKWPGTPSGPYGLFRPQMMPPSLVPSSWTNAHPFPPSPPPSVPPPPSIPPSQASICTPTQPCPSTPGPSQTTSRSPTGPPPRSNTASQSSAETRVYGFDLNEHWQADN